MCLCVCMYVCMYVQKTSHIYYVLKFCDNLLFFSLYFSYFFDLLWQQQPKVSNRPTLLFVSQL